MDIITISREFGSGGRELMSGSAWGQRDAYHLTVNTTEWEIKRLVPAFSYLILQEKHPLRRST